jgi:transcriptional repressor NrdR
MQCIHCEYPDTLVVYTRPNESGDTIKRRRECIRCRDRFTTYERITPSENKVNPPLIVPQK